MIILPCLIVHEYLVVESLPGIFICDNCFYMQSFAPPLEQKKRCGAPLARIRLGSRSLVIGMLGLRVFAVPPFHVFATIDGTEPIIRSARRQEGPRIVSYMCVLC